jgi:hypothetical protein
VDNRSLPGSLSLDEAYRAAYYMVLGYSELEREPSAELRR